MKKPDHISNSQISLGRCLFKYKKIRLEKEIDQSNDAMTEGKIVHDIIYEYTKHCVENGMDSDFDLMNDLIEKKYDDSLPQDTYLSMRENLMTFAQKGIEKDKILDYEINKTYSIGKDKNGKDVKIQVIIDRVNTYRQNNGSVIEIIDYKNQYNLMTKEDVEKSIQLRIYRYIAMRFMYPWAKNFKIGIYHTRYNYIVWGDLISKEDLSEEYENMESFLFHQWNRLTNSEDYPPEKGGACWEYGHCPLMKNGMCPLYTDSEIKKMSIDPDITEQVRVVRKLSSDVSRIKKEIQSYFKIYKGYEIDDIFTGYKEINTEKYDLKEVLSFMKRKEINLDGLTLGKTEIEKKVREKYSVKSFKKLPEDIKDDLENMKIHKKSVSFKI